MRVHFANVSIILLSISLSLIAENKPEEAYFTDYVYITICQQQACHSPTATNTGWPHKVMPRCSIAHICKTPK